MYNKYIIKFLFENLIINYLKILLIKSCLRVFFRIIIVIFYFIYKYIL